MRQFALLALLLIIATGCDRSSSSQDGTTAEGAARPQTDTSAAAEVPVPFKSSDYLVVERYGAQDASFPQYRTHHIAVTPDGYVVKATREGFHVQGKKGWSWNVEEQLVRGARDCSCEVFQRGDCAPDATLMMPELRPAAGNDAAAWRPPIYDKETRDVAAWDTKSSSAWLQGNIFFTSVCIDRFACGKGPKTVCDSVAVDLGGDEPALVPLESLGGKVAADLLKEEFTQLDEKTEEHKALSKAIEDGVEPALAEVQPTFDGKIRRRWVVPSRYSVYAGWSTDRVSMWDESPATGPLAIYTRIPRPISIFAPTLEGEMVGWTDGAFESDAPE